MFSEILIQRFFEALIDGDRGTALGIVEEQAARGAAPAALIADLFWPAYELADRLHRQDQLGDLPFNLATRLLRQVHHRTAAAMQGIAHQNGRLVLATCGPAEADELGAQMAVDLLGAHGFDVRFAGGGVAADEIQAYVQANQPEVLLMFCSAPGDLPHVRSVIDSLREVGACARTQFVLGGGVFNRAEGLAEEIGADLWAEHPLELAEIMANEPRFRSDRNSGNAAKPAVKVRRRAA